MVECKQVVYGVVSMVVVYWRKENVGLFVVDKND